MLTLFLHFISSSLQLRKLYLSLSFGFQLPTLKSAAKIRFECVRRLALRFGAPTHGRKKKDGRRCRWKFYLSTSRQLDRFPSLSRISLIAERSHVWNSTKISKNFHGFLTATGFFPLRTGDGLSRLEVCVCVCAEQNQIREHTTNSARHTPCLVEERKPREKQLWTRGRRWLFASCGWLGRGDTVTDLSAVRRSCQFIPVWEGLKCAMAD